ncbi:hypothetical protein COV06_03750 [Candidatus Uhrbacteria bacterium CG10_big_fil_rev_8_21_14_0_10_50_16]|uniref:Uncharacterized protein n=1 Tax=Candidatus Uhrbacteria bacterium CG10_big_fil_rev_8_21_14_0_10_50_16 TaxID=1975039 RepID=A0A2H0RLF2_9BACT|nr:MAG: hypothetical protein COV06_03750 [Candidatus Uhrbacteria bacterium CG10_big_fil_rev_8_21_14_0_10_50_16]
MESFTLSPKMPDPCLPFHDWVRTLLYVWAGYGGCRPPDAPQDKSCPDPTRTLSNETIDQIVSGMFCLPPDRMLAFVARHTPPNDDISANLGEGTILAGGVGASQIFYRFIRIIGSCGETVYGYRRYWHRPNNPIFPFPEDLQAAIDLGRRTCLFRIALGNVDEFTRGQIRFFSDLHVLLAAHP